MSIARQFGTADPKEDRTLPPGLVRGDIAALEKLAASLETEFGRLAARVAVLEANAAHSNMPQSNSVQSNKSNDAAPSAKPKFDKAAYQRDLMRKRRAAKKADFGNLE